jgi:hypothetical protein
MLAGSRKTTIPHVGSKDALHPENFARFVVLIFDVFFSPHQIRVCHPFYHLHNIAYTLVDHNKMVVFVKN